MISVPVRNIRSSRPCRNSTLLIRASGMSMPALVNNPCRNITLRSVMTKCVVRQFRNGHSTNHPTITSHTTPMTAITTFLAVAPQSVWLTTAAPNAASAVTSSRTRTGPINRFQCGCRCSTTRSSAARTLSG